MAVLFLADRRLEPDRLLRDLQHHAHLVERQLHLLGDLVGVGLAAELLHQVALRAHQLVDRLDHVHGDADRAGLVGDRARDRLADPPGGVGRELVAALVLELVDGLHQADVAFLDQVEELQPAVRVLLRDRDDQPQVRLDELALGLMRALGGLGGASRASALSSACVMRRSASIRAVPRRARRAGRSAIGCAPGFRAGGRAPACRGGCGASRGARASRNPAGSMPERLGQLARLRPASRRRSVCAASSRISSRTRACSNNASRAATRPLRRRAARSRRAAGARVSSLVRELRIEACFFTASASSFLIFASLAREVAAAILGRRAPARCRRCRRARVLSSTLALRSSSAVASTSRTPNGVPSTGRCWACSPDSMRIAISTSPSRVSSDTWPISRRYTRTGSLVGASSIARGAAGRRGAGRGPPRRERRSRRRMRALPGAARRRSRPERALHLLGCHVAAREAVRDQLLDRGQRGAQLRPPVGRGGAVLGFPVSGGRLAARPGAGGGMRLGGREGAGGHGGGLLGSAGGDRFRASGYGGE